MNNYIYLSLLFLILCLFILPKDNEEDFIIFFDSYGYVEGDEWVIPMRIYVYEYRPLAERMVVRLINRTHSLTQDQSQLFQHRSRYFMVDSESRERIQFMFDDDPERVIFTPLDSFGSDMTTNLNGFIVGTIRITKERARAIKEAQSSDNGWLSISSLPGRQKGTGKIQLIPQTGVSLISDVDDTIKITEIPAGSRIVIRNTFFKEYTAAPGMSDFYQDFDLDAYHYVTGSPWQLYHPLTDFLFDESVGFPRGTLHMKTVTKNFVSINTWRNLHELVTNDRVTFDQKKDQITTLFEHFPERQFILVGDSGETDPEIFSQIRNQFPDQVLEIFIRDVVNAAELNPERLREMVVIPAPTIEYGVSQFE